MQKVIIVSLLLTSYSSLCAQDSIQASCQAKKSTPYTSLFTNSSAGIFPTLSINYPLANYPLSGVCLHFEYTPTNKWLLKTSLYNGIAHDPQEDETFNPSRAFVVNPLRDGIFSLSELSYTQNGFCSGTYSLGVAVQTAGQGHKSTCSLWGTVEQVVFSKEQREIGFILHGGFAPSKTSECRYYCATGWYFAGLLLKEKRDQLGIYLNATEVSRVKERTFEITWQFQITDAIAVQPTYHHCRTGNQTANIGLVRVVFAFGV